MFESEKQNPTFIIITSTQATKHILLKSSFPSQICGVFPFWAKEFFFACQWYVILNLLQNWSGESEEG